MNIRLVSTSHMDVVKSRDDLAVYSYLEKQQQHWSCTARISLVLPIDEWQQNNVYQLSVVPGDEGRLGGSNVSLCL